MRTPAFAITAIAATLLTRGAAADPSAPSDDPQPTSGVPLLVTGAALSGIGAVNLATSGICKVSALIPDKSTENVCFDASLVLGGTLIAVGVPLLIVGLGQRSRYKDWLGRHVVVAGLSLAPVPGGGAIGWRASF